MKAKATALVLLSSLLWPSTGLGQVIPLEKGQLSPLSGMLISPESAAVIMAEKRAVPDLIAIEVKKAVDDANANCKLKLTDKDLAFQRSTSVLSAQVEQLEEKSANLAKQLQDAQNSTKWNQMYLTGGVIGGFVVGVLSTVLVIKATN